MISSGDLKWIAGFLEGEGSFSHGRRRTDNAEVVGSQVQLWPLEQLQQLLGGRIKPVKMHSKQWQQSYHWRVRNSAAIGVMMTLFPLLSPRRKDQIRIALARWKAKGVASKFRTHCKRGHPLVARQAYKDKPPSRWYRICAVASTQAGKKRSRRERTVCAEGHLLVIGGKRYCPICAGAKIKAGKARQRLLREAM